MYLNLPKNTLLQVWMNLAHQKKMKLWSLQMISIIQSEIWNWVHKTCQIPQFSTHKSKLKHAFCKQDIHVHIVQAMKMYQGMTCRLIYSSTPNTTITSTWYINSYRTATVKPFLKICSIIIMYDIILLTIFRQVEAHRPSVIQIRTLGLWNSLLVLWYMHPFRIFLNIFFTVFTEYQQNQGSLSNC